MTAVSIPDSTSCSYCNQLATGINGHGTCFCDHHGEMWMGIVFLDGKWVNHLGSGLEELAMLTMVAEETHEV